jgi:adenylate kinase
MPLHLVMLGSPGAGKGTQAERLARARGLLKISTGDILREAVHDGNDLGRRVKAIMDRGEYVSDGVMIDLVKARLGQPDARAGFVLDGFPRTVVQAAALDSIMNGRDPLVVVDIEVPEAELVRRLGARLICEDCGATAAGFDEGDGAAADTMVMPPGAGAAAESIAAERAVSEPRRCRRCGGRLVQRSDDNEAVVRERLKVFKRQTEPLIEYYRVRPTFRSIDGAQIPDRVAMDITAAIEAAAGARR